jgi:hypothetical protein
MGAVSEAFVKIHDDPRMNAAWLLILVFLAGLSAGVSIPRAEAVGSPGVCGE